MNDYSIRITFWWRLNVSLHILCRWSAEMLHNQPPSPVFQILPTVYIFNHRITNDIRHNFVLIVFVSLIFGGAFSILIWGICLVLLSLTALWISVDKILLASRTFPEFSDNNSKLFEVKIGLINDALIFNANFLGIMKGSVWILYFCQNFQYLLCSE